MHVCVCSSLLKTAWVEFVNVRPTNSKMPSTKETERVDTAFIKLLKRRQSANVSEEDLLAGWREDVANLANETKKTQQQLASLQKQLEQVRGAVDKKPWPEKGTVTQLSNRVAKLEKAARNEDVEGQLLVVEEEAKELCQNVAEQLQKEKKKRKKLQEQVEAFSGSAGRFTAAEPNENFDPSMQLYRSFCEFLTQKNGNFCTENGAPNTKRPRVPFQVSPMQNCFTVQPAACQPIQFEGGSIPMMASPGLPIAGSLRSSPVFLNGYHVYN